MNQYLTLKYLNNYYNIQNFSEYKRTMKEDGPVFYMKIKI